MAGYGKRKTVKTEGTSQPVHGRVLVQVRITPELRAKAHAAAKLLNISTTVYIAELITRDVVDAEGRPEWTPTLVTPDELPPAAAQLDIAGAA